jgi:hypothetical protein
MRKLALAAIFVGVSALAACGGGGDNGDDVQIGPDANLNTGTCNPVSQTGCAADQKCTWVEYQEDPALGKTECVTNGTVPVGGACTRGEPGATTGFDDCDKSYCVNGTCTEICSQSQAASCPDNKVCVLYADTFDDLGDDSTVGLCGPTCDPVSQNCTNETEGCYLLINQGKGTCARVPSAAAGRDQNDDCYGPASGGCYLNGCDKGYQAILLKEPGSQQATCGKFCTPVNTYKDNAAANDLDGTAPNDCAATTLGGVTNQGCGFIQSIYGSATTFDPKVIDAGFGICYNGDVWDVCTKYEPLKIVEQWNAGYTGAPAGSTEEQKIAAAVASFCNFCGGTVNAMGRCQDQKAQCTAGAGCMDLAEEKRIFDQLLPGDGAKAIILRHIREDYAKKFPHGLILPDGQVLPAPSVD